MEKLSKMHEKIAEYLKREGKPAQAVIAYRLAARGYNQAYLANGNRSDFESATRTLVMACRLESTSDLGLLLHLCPAFKEQDNG